MEQVIAEIPKNKTETVRIALTEYNGHDLIALRVFVQTAADDEPRPTKKGVTLRVTLLPEIIEALGEAHEAAIEAGLLEG